MGPIRLTDPQVYSRGNVSILVRMVRSQRKLFPGEDVHLFNISCWLCVFLLFSLFVSMSHRKADSAFEVRGMADEARLAHEVEVALEVRGFAEQVRLACDRVTCCRINRSSSIRTNGFFGWLFVLGTLSSVSICSQRAQTYIHRCEVEKLDAVDGRSRAGAWRSCIVPATE